MSLAIISLLEGVINQWNTNNEKLGNPDQYSVIVGKGNRPVQMRKSDNSILQGEYPYSEILLTHKNTITNEVTILHRLECPIDKKLKKTSNNILAELYKMFLYDITGTFCLASKQLVHNNQKAKHDLSKTYRIVGEDKYVGATVEIIKDDKDSWYKIGEKYDVFSQGDNGWAVYSDFNIHNINNGIGIIPGKDCKYTAKVKLELV